MKIFSLLAVIATLLTVSSAAQTETENLGISISGGSILQRPVILNVEFSPSGNTAFDQYDTTSFISSSDVATALPDTNRTDTTSPDSSSLTSVFDSLTNNYHHRKAENSFISIGAISGSAVIPFTVSSDEMIIDKFDSRPVLNRYSVLNFGIGSDHADTIMISAFTSNNSIITFVYLHDISTGIFYQLLDTNVSLIIPANSVMSANYDLYIMVKSTINSLPVTCSGNTNGSIQLHCPDCSDWNYQVSNNGNTIFSAAVYNQDTTLNDLQSGFYAVKIYIRNLLADSQYVQINSPLAVVAGFSISNSIVSVTDLALFENQSTGATIYNWNFGDNSATDTSLNTAHHFPLAGNYVVTLTAKNEDGCSASFTDTIFVTTANNPFHPAIGSNLSHINLFYAADSSGINVTTSSQRIAVSQDETIQQINIQVLNMNGQLIRSVSTSESNETIEVSQSGIYIVNITRSNGEVITEKVFVNN